MPEESDFRIKRSGNERGAQETRERMEMKSEEEEVLNQMHF